MGQILARSVASTLFKAPGTPMREEAGPYMVIPLPVADIVSYRSPRKPRMKRTMTTAPTM